MHYASNVMRLFHAPVGMQVAVVRQSTFHSADKANKI